MARQNSIFAQELKFIYRVYRESYLIWLAIQQIAGEHYERQISRGRQPGINLRSRHHCFDLYANSFQRFGFGLLDDYYYRQSNCPVFVLRQVSLQRIGLQPL
jgi:hypothetical protein